MADERARQLRKTMTPQEVKLWSRLRRLRECGIHFRRQSPVRSYIVDFECRRARLIVEVDGGQHGIARNSRRDRSRDELLAQAGYKVLRFWNHEVDQGIEGVLETIVRAVDTLPHPAARSARSHPPLKGREKK